MQRYTTGIRLKYGCKSILFRDAREIKADKHQLTFITAVTCLGNNIDSDGNRVMTLLNPSTYSGLENCIPNPVHIRFKREGTITTVTAYLQYLDSYEVVAGG